MDKKLDIFKSTTPDETDQRRAEYFNVLLDRFKRYKKEFDDKWGQLQKGDLIKFPKGWVEVIDIRSANNETDTIPELHYSYETTIFGEYLVLNWVLAQNTIIHNWANSYMRLMTNDERPVLEVVHKKDRNYKSKLKNIKLMKEEEDIFKPIKPDEIKGRTQEYSDLYVAKNMKDKNNFIEKYGELKPGNVIKYKSPLIHINPGAYDKEFLVTNISTRIAGYESAAGEDLIKGTEVEIVDLLNLRYKQKSFNSETKDLHLTWTALLDWFNRLSEMISKNKGGELKIIRSAIVSEANTIFKPAVETERDKEFLTKIGMGDINKVQEDLLKQAPIYANTFVISPDISLNMNDILNLLILNSKYDQTKAQQWLWIKRPTDSQDQISGQYFSDNISAIDKSKLHFKADLEGKYVLLRVPIIEFLLFNPIAFRAAIFENDKVKENDYLLNLIKEHCSANATYDENLNKILHYVFEYYQLQFYNINPTVIDDMHMIEQNVKNSSRNMPESVQSAIKEEMEDPAIASTPNAIPPPEVAPDENKKRLDSYIKMNKDKFKEKYGNELEIGDYFETTVNTEKGIVKDIFKVLDICWKDNVFKLENENDKKQRETVSIDMLVNTKLENPPKFIKKNDYISKEKEIKESEELFKPIDPKEVDEREKIYQQKAIEKNIEYKKEFEERFGELHVGDMIIPVDKYGDDLPLEDHLHIKVLELSKDAGIDTVYGVDLQTAEDVKKYKLAPAGWVGYTYDDLMGYLADAQVNTLGLDYSGIAGYRIQPANVTEATIFKKASKDEGENRKAAYEQSLIYQNEKDKIEFEKLLGPIKKGSIFSYNFMLSGAMQTHKLVVDDIKIINFVVFADRERIPLEAVTIHTAGVKDNTLKSTHTWTALVQVLEGAIDIKLIKEEADLFKPANTKDREKEYINKLIADDEANKKEFTDKYGEIKIGDTLRFKRNNNNIEDFIINNIILDDPKQNPSTRIWIKRIENNPNYQSLVPLSYTWKNFKSLLDHHDGKHSIVNNSLAEIIRESTQLDIFKPATEVDAKTRQQQYDNDAKINWEKHNSKINVGDYLLGVISSYIYEIIEVTDYSIKYKFYGLVYPDPNIIIKKDSPINNTLDAEIVDLTYQDSFFADKIREIFFGSIHLFTKYNMGEQDKGGYMLIPHNDLKQNYVIKESEDIFKAVTDDDLIERNKVMQQKLDATSKEYKQKFIENYGNLEVDDKIAFLDKESQSNTPYVSYTIIKFLRKNVPFTDSNDGNRILYDDYINVWVKLFHTPYGFSGEYTWEGMYKYFENYFKKYPNIELKIIKKDNKSNTNK